MRFVQCDIISDSFVLLISKLRFIDTGFWRNFLILPLLLLYRAVCHLFLDPGAIRANTYRNKMVSYELTFRNSLHLLNVENMSKT